MSERFTFEERASDSPFIEKIWRTQNATPLDFTSLAESHSEIVVAKLDGKAMLAVRGPETKATIASAPGDSEFFGIVFKMGTYMPTLLPKNLTDRRDAHLPPGASHSSFWLNSSTWEVPNFDNADIFVERLVRLGLLAHDPIVADALAGHEQAYSPRALQYRFLRATGLPHKLIQQIRRAHNAARLLEGGSTITDIALQLGYFDQSHLTNALKRFIGQTPGKIAQVNMLE